LLLLLLTWAKYWEISLLDGYFGCLPELLTISVLELLRTEVWLNCILSLLGRDTKLETLDWL